MGIRLVYGEKRQRTGRTPGRFAHAGPMAIAPAFWSAAALRRFPWQANVVSDNRNGYGRMGIKRKDAKVGEHRGENNLCVTLCPLRLCVEFFGPWVVHRY